MTERAYRMIDLFAGCGGLEDGFLQSGRFTDVAAVEWLKPQVDTLRNRLATKWNVADSNERVLWFDIQREDELFHGWQDDEQYGSGIGLDKLVAAADGVDVIIGGPPCQAYSLAGRVRDEHGMHDDYRNYLFEHYLKVVERYRPDAFIFENVPGMLSAVPDGTPITTLIRDGFSSIGYAIIDDLARYAKINANDYGVPQIRNRMIILGLNLEKYKDTQEKLERFYTTYLPQYRSGRHLTVGDAIGDLPAIYPVDTGEKKHGKAYTEPVTDITWHQARFQSKRDKEIFRMLAEDIETGEFKYTDSATLTKIYEDRVGSRSPIHRYHVLRKDQPSTTIIAHLYKDGNRFIHYDSRQARTITPREAARLQSFDDDFNFIGNRGSVYQMIGNAVPPKLAKSVALALADFLEKE